MFAVRKGAWGLILWGAMLLAGTAAHAQPATVRGFVTDASDGQAMELVNVVLTPLPDGPPTGTVTNAEGVYVVPGLAAGRYRVQASFVGYETFSDTLALAAGALHAFNIPLTPSAETLDEVVVETERRDGVARVVAGQQTVRPAEIELVPAPDLSADLAGYLTTLPAVVTVGDRGGQLFIRGGEPSQNLVLLDGMPVYQPFHMLGFYSAFPAEVLRAADVYAGGFGARYGGRLSSVVDIATRPGNTRRFAGTASLSPFVSGLQAEAPLLSGRASVLVSARRSFLEEGAERYTSTPMPYRFGDALLRLHAQPTTMTRFSLTGLDTYDRGTLGDGGAGEAGGALRWRNQALGGRFLFLPDFAPFLGDVHLSYSRLRSEQGPEGAPLRTSSVSELRGTAVGTFYSGRDVDTEAGVEVSIVTVANELGGLFQNTFLEDTTFETVAFYVEPEWTPTPGLRVRPGLRFQLYRLDARPHAEPRLRVVWERGRHQLSAAAGLYHQEVVGLSDRRDATGVFTAWSFVPGTGARDDDFEAGRLARAVHALAGYRVTPWPGLDLSVEGYYKDVEDIFVAEWTAYPRLTTNLQPADGRTYGFDARLSLRAGAVRGDLSYGYANTVYDARRPRYELWYGTETLRFRPPHDRRHQVNVLVGASLAGFDLNARWQFGSGLPFSRALGFGTFVLMDGPGVDVTQQGTRRVIYERPYNAVLPTFHRLDASVERTFTLGRTALTVQASAINAYDRRNIFYLDVFTLHRADQLPFVPSLGLKVDFE